MRFITGNVGGKFIIEMDSREVQRLTGLGPWDFEHTKFQGTSLDLHKILNYIDSIKHILVNCDKFKSDLEDIEKAVQKFEFPLQPIGGDE